MGWALSVLAGISSPPEIRYSGSWQSSKGYRCSDAGNGCEEDATWRKRTQEVNKARKWYAYIDA
jgi:hypothetical protein